MPSIDYYCQQLLGVAIAGSHVLDVACLLLLLSSIAWSCYFRWLPTIALDVAIGIYCLWCCDIGVDCLMLISTSIHCLTCYCERLLTVSVDLLMLLLYRRLPSVDIDIEWCLPLLLSWIVCCYYQLLDDVATTAYCLRLLYVTIGVERLLLLSVACYCHCRG